MKAHEGRRHPGSPPRVWGIRLLIVYSPSRSRFTPTRVGNTRPERLGNDRAAGSPPRVWGIRAACSLSVRRVAVHPHACGEYISPCDLILTTSGSPPRVWGILPTRPSRPSQPRFTPTRVGNTRTPTRRTIRPPVHPHACGEYFFDLMSDLDEVRFTPTRVGNTGLRRPCRVLVGGSPPRVWGIRSIRPAARR